MSQRCTQWLVGPSSRRNASQTSCIDAHTSTSRPTRSYFSTYSESHGCIQAVVSLCSRRNASQIAWINTHASSLHFLNPILHSGLGEAQVAALSNEIPVEALGTFTPSTHVVYNRVALDSRDAKESRESRSSKGDARMSLKWRCSSVTCSSAASNSKRTVFNDDCAQGLKGRYRDTIILPSREKHYDPM